MHLHHVDWINIIVETKHLIARRQLMRGARLGPGCDSVTSNLGVEPPSLVTGAR